MKKGKDQNICVRISRDEQQIERCKERIQAVASSLSGVSQILALGGNEVRLRILFLLQGEQKLCVCDLSEILEMKIPAISQHLRKMKDVGLVFTEREGTVIYYQISEKHKHTLDAILNLISEPSLV